MEQKLFHKDFTLVVIGQIISLFGNAILRFALPLYLLRMSGSAALFGLVNATAFLPMIVLSLLGGVLADRVNKRNIMVFLDFTTALIILVFYLILDMVPLVPLLIVTLMLLYGISGTYQPAVQASIPALVSDSKLLSGNAVINQISALAGLLGPVIGGMLYGVWGINPILIISIICFLLSAIMEIFIHIPFVKRNDQSGMLSIVKSDLHESLDFVKKEQPAFIEVGVLMVGINMVLSSMIMVGIPVIIINILKLSDEQLGFTQGALALGGLVGGILTAVLGDKVKLTKAHLLLLACSFCVVLFSICMYLEFDTTTMYYVITIGSFFAMIFSTIFSIQIITVVQMHTPMHLIGKVMACLMAFIMCAQPIGQSIYGILFEQFANYTWAILLGASLISCLLSIYSKRIFVKLHATTK